MSLYIHPENQTILWNAIMSSPLFPNFNTYPKRKEDWFREAIQMFYKNSKKVINSQELQIMNRDTIAYMVNKMKIYHRNSNTLHLYNKPPSINMGMIDINKQANLGRVGDTGSIATRSIITEQKEEFISRQFNERQKDYQSMLLNEPPKDVDFHTMSMDEPISNMEELIKQHMLERDAELIQYAPPPIINNSKNISTSNNTPILKIDNTTIEAPFLTNVIEFNSDDAPNTIGKNVHWSRNDSTVSSLLETTDISGINLNDVKQSITDLREEYYKDRQETHNLMYEIKQQLVELKKLYEE